MLTRLLRFLGYDEPELVWVPLAVWHRTLSERDALRVRCDELAARLEDYETQPSTTQITMDIKKPGLFLLGSTRVKVQGRWMNRFTATQIGETEAALAAVEQGKP